MLSYDLRLKSRISLTNIDGERFAIKNLDGLKGLRNGQEINLLNYPYGDTGITLNRQIKKKN